jgi:hypothetical protein
MSRVKLSNNQQEEFLNRVAKYFNSDWSKVAKISNICERSLRDWRREKYNMSYEALQKLHKFSNVPIPKAIKILPEFWSARKYASLGALKRNRIYGNPGTPEGRSRGGHATWRKYRFNPQRFEGTRFIGPKDIDYPSKSPSFSEVVGIILGDGSITDYQVVISLNSKMDKEYTHYVSQLFKKLFNLKAVLTLRKNNTCNIVLSSVELIRFLNKAGLKKGNKVHNQIGVPKWILKNNKFKISCLRGLIDTDGSFYSYKHKVNGKIYENYAVDFTNRSLPLLRATRDILLNLGCLPTSAKFKVILNKKEDIRRFITVVGTGNPRTKEKFKKFLEN